MKFVSFFIIFKYILSFNQQNPYFSKTFPEESGETYQLPEKGENEFSCNCDLTENSCDYQCCCDRNCPKKLRDHWRDNQECKDNVNSLNVFNYKCINEHLFFVKKTYPRKGVKELKEKFDDKQCYGNDNSAKMKEIYKLLKDNLERYDKVYSLYIENKILNTFNFNYTDGQFIKSINNRKFGLISAEGSNYFSTDGVFTIYSKGAYGECVPGKTIQYFENIRSTECLMTLEKNEIQNYCNSLFNLKIANKNINKTFSIYYQLSNFKILKMENNPNCDSNEYPVEINFNIITSGDGKSIEDIQIESVFNRTDNNDDKIQFLFTFSLNFYTINENNNYFMFSGNPGYLPNYPLLILNDDNTFYKYGYVMVGKDIYGNCQQFLDEDQLESYIYGYDSPILFGQNYNYICSFYYKKNITDNNFNEVDYFTNLTLVIKAFNIKEIAAYGNYNNEIRIPVINTKLEKIFKNNKFEDCDSCSKDFCFPRKITLNIYVGKKENYYIVVNAKYVLDYYCSELDNEKEYNLVFSVNYNYIENGNREDNILFKKPDLPTILPKLPKDLMDPIKEINVNS